MSKNVIILLAFAVLATAFADNVTAVNLQVSERRVIGHAKGLADDRNVLQRQAVANARGDADVLLEPHFFYEEEGDSLLVTVTGLQARYVSDNQETVRLVVAPSSPQPQPQALPQVLPQALTDVTRNTRPPLESGLYVSVKAQTAIPWSSMGANFQIGYFSNRTFWGLDFGAGQPSNFGWNTPPINADDFIYYSGALSFGGRMKPNDYFQTVLGANVGVFTKFNDEFSGNSWNSDRRVRSSEFIMAQGAFVKFIFGAERLKFEVSNRLAFGSMFGVFIMEAGVVYAP